MTKQYLIFSSVMFTLFFIGCKDKVVKVNQDTEIAGTVDSVFQKYENGQISRTYIRIGGKIDGEMKDFYPTGELKSLRYFEDDNQIGKSTFFFQSGAIKEVQYYADGLRQLADTMFYESGKIQYITEFKDDKRNGIFRSLNEDGSVIFDLRYKGDVLVQD